MATILIIDDSKSTLALAESFLTPGGHTVISCLSAKAAMTVIARNEVDLIITDIYMPDMDGLEVIRAAQRICPKVPIIAMSGATGVRDVRKVAAALGAVGMLQKPFSKEQLAEAVASAVAPVRHPKASMQGVPLA